MPAYIQKGIYMKKSGIIFIFGTSRLESTRQVGFFSDWNSLTSALLLTGILEYF
jgi:hypothetical protein